MKTKSWQNLNRSKKKLFDCLINLFLLSCICKRFNKSLCKVSFLYCKIHLNVKSSFNGRTILSDNVSARRDTVSSLQHEQTMSAYIRLYVQVVNGSAPGLIRSGYAESYDITMTRRYMLFFASGAGIVSVVFQALLLSSFLSMHGALTYHVVRFHYATTLIDIIGVCSHRTHTSYVN